MSADEKNDRLKLLCNYQAAFWPQPSDAHVLLTLAESYSAISCYDQAIDLLTHAINTTPKSALLYVRIAEAFQQIGKMDGAILNFAAASQIDPDNEFDATSEIYEIVSGLSDRTKALEALRKINAQFPKEDYFAEMLAEFCSLYGEYDEAERIYRLFLNRDLPLEEEINFEWRLSTVLIDKRRYDEGFSRMERVLPRLGAGYDIDYIERQLADSYLKAGVFEKALKIYLFKADHSFPGERRAEMLRKAAKCYEHLGKHHKAIDCLIEVLSFARETGSADDTPAERQRVIPDPHFYEDIYGALTRCYEKDNDFVRAKAAFQKEKEYHVKGLETGK